MTRSEMLREAEKIVTKDRNKEYGGMEDNFFTIARMWSAYKGVHFDPKDVPAMMGCVKIARIGSGQVKADNWIDLAGYAACGCEIQTKEVKE